MSVSSVECCGSQSKGFGSWNWSCLSLGTSMEEEFSFSAGSKFLPGLFLGMTWGVGIFRHASVTNWRFFFTLDASLATHYNDTVILPHGKNREQSLLEHILLEFSFLTGSNFLPRGFLRVTWWEECFDILQVYCIIDFSFPNLMLHLRQAITIQLFYPLKKLDMQHIICLTWIYPFGAHRLLWRTCATVNGRSIAASTSDGIITNNYSHSLTSTSEAFSPCTCFLYPWCRP